MKTVDIPINAAKKVALDYGYDQVIIIGRKCGKGGREHCTTYGINKEHCQVAARAGDFLKYKVMGWVAADNKESQATFAQQTLPGGEDADPISVITKELNRRAEKYCGAIKRS